jgi:hypothetical protein
MVHDGGLINGQIVLTWRLNIDPLVHYVAQSDHSDNQMHGQMLQRLGT